MIRDIFNEIFGYDSTIGRRLFSGAYALVFLVILLYVGALGISYVDEVGVPPSGTAATIIDAKQIVPAHITPIIVTTSNATTSIPVYEATGYTVSFKIDQHPLTARVTEDFYDAATVGDHVEVRYGRGRLTRSYVPEQIRLLGQTNE